jgi:GNAT superfamily N-acetyltransferase
MFSYGRGGNTFMTFTLRPLQLPDDYARIAELRSSVRTEPILAADLEREDSFIPPKGNTYFDENGLLAGHCRERVVAVNEDGYVIGFAVSWRAPFTPPGDLSSHLVVDAGYRKQGVGQQLAAHLENWAREVGASRLLSELPDHLPEARAFVEKRGYVIELHMFQSVLDLATYDETPFAEAVEAAEQSGIRWVTGAELKEEAALRASFDMVVEAAKDVPGANFVPQFEEWQEAVSEQPDDFLHFAKDGDRYVGVTQLRPLPEGGLYNEFTGVLREYRGRCIATALKVLAARAAKRHGAPYMRTDNADINAPMLAVNRKMGYVPVPGHYRIVKELVRPNN